MLLKKLLTVATALMCLLQINLAAATVTVNMYLTIKNVDDSYIGQITLKDTPFGLLITPHLKDLTTGIHGFHIHEFPSCANAGKAAGGHFDPAKTGKHLGPYNPNGHLGDLPALYVNNNGKANLPILAPRLKESDVIGHSMMIHANGDNYSDIPKKLGGSGDRVACGVITNRPVSTTPNGAPNR